MKIWDNLKNWQKKTIYLLFVIIIITLIYNIGGWVSVLLIVLVIIGYTSYRVWNNRVSFMTSIRYVESMIWGKPLDKDMWSDKEFSNTKVKFVWRKKKNESKITESETISNK
jgi:hypothetical protein